MFSYHPGLQARSSHQNTLYAYELFARFMLFNSLFSPCLLSLQESRSMGGWAAFARDGCPDGRWLEGIRVFVTADRDSWRNKSPFTFARSLKNKSVSCFGRTCLRHRPLRSLCRPKIVCIYFCPVTFEITRLRADLYEPMLFKNGQGWKSA